jgi:hypothetical protein
LESAASFSGPDFEARKDRQQERGAGSRFDAGKEQSMSPQFRTIGFGAVALLGLTLASCDNPAAPTRQPGQGGTPQVTVVRLEIAAPASIAPQESAQLTANAVKSDGSVENVTGQAQWSSSNSGVISVSSAGVATAVRPGEVMVLARYQAHNSSARLFAMPPGTHKLSGRITESGFPLGGVSVVVLAGVGEGLATSSDGSGSYALYGVAGRVRLQAKKEGYLDEIEELEVGDANAIHDIEMAPERERTNLSGTYSLTVSAGPCTGSQSSSLPDEARSRTYTAVVEQEGAPLTVSLSGAEFIITSGRGDHFAGSVDPLDNVTFGIGDSYYYGYYPDLFDLVERFTSTSALLVNGIVTAKATSSDISGNLNGLFLIANATSGPFRPYSAKCYSSAHEFRMQRQ